ncbi:MAG: lysophospholipid acyltransferase family protein [Cardiobacteriaceae bacterium]|nr:lysophospholipid acyltransferase family protein [Cardiobacteriaceae bacterium]
MTFSRLAAVCTDRLLCWLVSFITGIRPARDNALAADDRPTVYYANHASHGDFMLVWVSLPARQRMQTRPVAGADYWEKTALRRFIGRQVFDAVLIERQSGEPQAATAQLSAVLDQGQSLIVFPEGTRNTDENVRLQPFKSGIYHVAQAHPDVRFVPVWIHNINRVLPKGKWLPVPLLCSVNIGEAVQLSENEEKTQFLERLRHALLDLAPSTDTENRA